MFFLNFACTLKTLIIGEKMVQFSTSIFFPVPKYEKLVGGLGLDVKKITV